MLAGLKLFKRKRATVKNNFRSKRCSEKFHKINGKQLRRSLFLKKLHANSKFFTGDCFSDLFGGPVKKASENVYISLKTEYKHHVT